MSSVDIDDTDMPEYFEAKALKQPPRRPTGDWPFPAPSGPVPWTEKQKREYAREQRQQLPESPL